MQYMYSGMAVASLALVQLLLFSECTKKLNTRSSFQACKSKMASVGILGKLKQFDAYPKTLEDFRIKTYGGAASKFN